MFVDKRRSFDSTNDDDVSFVRVVVFSAIARARAPTRMCTRTSWAVSSMPTRSMMMTRTRTNMTLLTNLLKNDYFILF